MRVSREPAVDGQRRLKAADGEGALTVAQDLIRIDTTNPPGAERPAAQCIGAFLDAAGLEVEFQEVDPGSDRANVVARIRGQGSRPGLLLSGHLDTVPADPAQWSVSPHAATVRDGCLIGRGAVDMKSAIAAMAIAARNVNRSEERPAGDLVLAFTAGEEVDSCGARLLADSELLADVAMAVVGEPTGLDVGIGHRGVLWVQAEASGEGAHGSQPASGVNAVRELIDWLHPFATIEQLVSGGSDGVLGTGSVSLNVISGGEAANVVPDSAFAILDFRTLCEHDHGQLLSALQQRPAEVSLQVLRDAPAIATPGDSPLVEAAIAAVSSVTHRRPAVRGLPYFTDAGVFVDKLDIPVVILGPGSEAAAHASDESIEVTAIEAATGIYQDLIMRLIYS